MNKISIKNGMICLFFRGKEGGWTPKYSWGSLYYTSLALYPYALYTHIVWFYGLLYNKYIRARSCIHQEVITTFIHVVTRTIEEARIFAQKIEKKRWRISCCWCCCCCCCHSSTNMRKKCGARRYLDAWIVVAFPVECQSKSYPFLSTHPFFCNV